MNTEGKTPSTTPPTRTRLAFYFVPWVEDGSIGYGDESWPVRGHVVECPMEVGDANQWAHATPDQVNAAIEREKTKAGEQQPPAPPAPPDDKKTKAEAKAEAKAAADKAAADKAAADKAAADKAAEDAAK